MRFRKKPVVIDAIEWTGENWGEVASFLVNANAKYDYDHGELALRTLEGQHIASHGDWIIRGVAGEVYPCKPEIFAQTYDPAGE